MVKRTTETQRLHGEKLKALTRTAAKGRQPQMVDRNGRDGEIRTRDLTHPKRARYQAAPRPVENDLVSLQQVNCQIRTTSSRTVILASGNWNSCFPAPAAPAARATRQPIVSTL